MINEKFAATAIHVFCGKLLVEHKYLCSLTKPTLLKESSRCSSKT